MFNAAVCDDEKEITGYISRLIEKYLPGCQVKRYTSGIELLSDIENSGNSIDILFLDIQMDGLDGMETARKLRESNSGMIIIFISAVKEYVFSAFDVDAFNYILKPVDEDRFREILERAVCKLNEKSEKQHILINTRKKNIKLDIAGILYFENEMRKIAVHTLNDVIKFYGAMTDMEKQLGDDFFRCHRGYLVNMGFIEEYDSENIYLKNGERIYMAKEKYGEFVKRYMRFLRNGGTLYV